MFRTKTALQFSAVHDIVWFVRIDQEVKLNICRRTEVQNSDEGLEFREVGDQNSEQFRPTRGDGGGVLWEA